MTYESLTGLWRYNGGDVFLCGNLYFREGTMSCTNFDGVYSVEAVIFTTEQNVVGPPDLMFQIDTDPFDLLVVWNSLTGFVISGCPNNNGDLHWTIKKPGT